MQISHVKLTSTTLQNLVANKEKIVQLFEAGDIGGARKRMRTAQYPDGGAVQVKEGWSEKLQVFLPSKLITDNTNI